MLVREFSRMCCTPQYNNSRHNRRVCRPYLDTTRRQQSSTWRRASTAPTTRCSPTSHRAPRKRRPITPAVAWTRKESQSKVTRTDREFGLEDPELQVPNKPQIPSSKSQRKATRGRVRTPKVLRRRDEIKRASAAFRTKCFGVRCVLASLSSFCSRYIMRILRFGI